MIASRRGWIGRGADETGDPSPASCRMLEGVLRVEVVAYRAGVSFPAGGSLFVVAHRN